MSQLIEIIRRLLIAVIWIVTISVTALFVFALFIEDQKLIAVLFLLGYIFVGWQQQSLLTGFLANKSN